MSTYIKVDPVGGGQYTVDPNNVPSGSLSLSTLVPCFHQIPEPQGEVKIYFIPFDVNGEIITDLSQISNIHYLFVMGYADPKFYYLADNHNPDFIPLQNAFSIQGFVLNPTTIAIDEGLGEITPIITYSDYELSTIKLADLPTLGQYS